MPTIFMPRGSSKDGRPLRDYVALKGSTKATRFCEGLAAARTKGAFQTRPTGFLSVLEKADEFPRITKSARRREGVALCVGTQNFSTLVPPRNISRIQRDVACNITSHTISSSALRTVWLHRSCGPWFTGAAHVRAIVRRCVERQQKGQKWRVLTCIA